MWECTVYVGVRRFPGQQQQQQQAEPSAGLRNPSQTALPCDESVTLFSQLQALGSCTDPSSFSIVFADADNMRGSPAGVHCVLG